MGLIFAAMAGYDPAVAIPFWQRMAAVSGSSSNDSDIFSDHPSDAKRIAAIQKELPEAEKYYQASGYARKTTTTSTTKRTTRSRKSSKRR
jgi:predicted Zn-dependent protease